MDLQDEASFTHPVQVGEDFEDIIPLRASINGVAAHEIMVCTPNSLFLLLLLVKSVY